ncbi:endonuclease domain-containing protein [bacterium]|nr:endonuclease domain-containing protein [bacterium]
MRLYNKKELQEHRRALRSNMPHAEAKLWIFIRKKQIEGIRFRRQFSVGSYILDFYSPECRLAIELDGSSHNNEFSQEYDEERTKYLNSANIEVIRFKNEEVFDNIDGVIEQIKTTISNSKDPL